MYDCALTKSLLHIIGILNKQVTRIIYCFVFSSIKLFITEAPNPDFSHRLDDSLCRLQICVMSAPDLCHVGSRFPVMFAIKARR